MKWRPRRDLKTSRSSKEFQPLSRAAEPASAEPEQWRRFDFDLIDFDLIDFELARQSLRSRFEPTGFVSPDFEPGAGRRPLAEAQV